MIDAARFLAGSAAAQLSRIGLAGDPITVHLRGFATTHTDKSLEDAMREAETDADWHGYVSTDWTAQLADRSTASTVARTDSLAFGTYHVGPDAVYHEHGHAAREVYLVAEGRCEFLGAGGWRSLAAGQASVQEPEVIHALKTSDEPLWVFWAWTGDIDEPIWAFDENGDRFFPEREPR